MGARLETNTLDRVLLAVAPKWALDRIRARAMALTIARHFEAAQGGRRTANWHKTSTDANAANGPALAQLRIHARDLVRNNEWATNGQRVVARNTVGWGVVPKPVEASPKRVTQAGVLWKKWADSTECDSEGRSTFYGIQRQAMETISVAGEVLVRRRQRRLEDKLTIPLQLQVLEPDFLDTGKDGLKGPSGGPIIQGVEYDQLGRRSGYWLFPEHPGSSRIGSLTSRRVAAEEILHVFRTDRPGQVRGVSWFAPAIVTLKDLDEYEDATLMRQKIAACFTAFVTDVDGAGTAIAEQDEDDELLEQLQPGLVSYLTPGKDVKFANPPLVNEDSFTAGALRKVAAGIGCTYEDLTGHYGEVNFSSARMARLAHWANVHDWRWNMLIPQLCNPVWTWAMQAALIAGSLPEAPAAAWTPPPMPMIEPDKEGLAYSRLVRNGAMTHDEMVREQGADPETHWAEYSEGLKRLDREGIVLDSDARKTSAAGLTQERAGGKQSVPPDPVTEE